MDLDISFTIKLKKKKEPEIKTVNRSRDTFKLQDFITSPALNFELEFHEILRLLCYFT